MQQEKYYECIVCKKLTTGFPVTLRNKFPVCRNIEFRNMYEKQRLNKLTKKELQAKHKKVQEKIKSTAQIMKTYIMMISCAVMIIKMRTLFLKRLPKIHHQNEICCYHLVRPWYQKRKKLETLKVMMTMCLKRSEVLDMGI